MGGQPASRFIFSILASFVRGGRQENSVAHGVVEAGGLDEANGKARRIAHAHFPRSRGWFGHTAEASSADAAPIDPDNVAACADPF